MDRSDAAPKTSLPPRIARGGWLDALRFIVGALIILYHFREAAPVPLPQVHPVFDRGYLLTDFFIIDSGYVLARIYGDRVASGQASLRAYARQRLLRVIPAHLVVSLVLVLLVAGAALAGVTPSNPRWFDWSQLPAQVLLVQAYGVPGGQGWNAPTWTLSALIGCYLLLPWICRALWRWPPVVVVIGATLLVLAADVAASVWLGDPIYRLPMRYGILRALPLFLLGVAAAFYGARVYVSLRRAGGIGVGAAVALVVLQAFGAFSLLSLGLMTVIIWAAGAVPVLRPSRLIEHLALMSFSMFLTNEVSRIVWFGLLDALEQEAWSSGVRWVLWAVGFVGAFVAAAVFRYGFDRPVQTWLNRSGPAPSKTGAPPMRGRPLSPGPPLRWSARARVFSISSGGDQVSYSSPMAGRSGKFPLRPDVGTFGHRRRAPQGEARTPRSAPEKFRRDNVQRRSSCVRPVRRAFALAYWSFWTLRCSRVAKDLNQRIGDQHDQAIDSSSPWRLDHSDRPRSPTPPATRRQSIGVAAMRRFIGLVLITLLATAPAMGLRLSGWRPDPVADALIFGVAVLAAGFLLSWGAEAAEKHISQGLIVAIVALVTVMPEYAVDLYYAWRAGQAPESSYIHYAAANMTGANRLLVGLAWPLMVLLHWARSRQKSVELAPVNAVEVSFLLLGSAYAFVILLKGAISAIDFLALFAIFSGYLYRVSTLPRADDEEDEDEEPGPARALAKLRPATQWTWMGGLTLVAFVVIFASAEPFAESMVGAGRRLGIDQFLLIQWLAPLASEAPAVSIAILFVLAGRAASGLTAMVSDKINQWTLLVGMLPLAMSLGAGGLVALPLDARQQEEFLLTAAQSIFAIGLLLKLRLSVASASILFGLFAVQVGLAFHFRDDEAKTISSLTVLAWVYLGLSLPLFALQGRRIVDVVRAGLFTSHRRLAATQTHARTE